MSIVQWASYTFLKRDYLGMGPSHINQDLKINIFHNYVLVPVWNDNNKMNTNRQLCAHLTTRYLLSYKYKRFFLVKTIQFTVSPRANQNGGT